MERKKLVLYTVGEIGHLFPMVELGKNLCHDFCVTIVFLQSVIIKPEPVEYFISRVSATHPSLSFHRLIPTLPLQTTTASNPSVSFFNNLRSATPLLLDYLNSSSPIHNLILDLFCSKAISIATQLNIPFYVFCPISALCATTYLYLPTLHDISPTSLKDLGDAPVFIPGLTRPILASDVMGALADRENDGYKDLVVQFELCSLSKCLLINSFEELEPQVFRDLANGLCVPGRRMPPVYGVGPIIANNKEMDATFDKDRLEILTWLDIQPNKSVVYVSFGSMGALSEAQVQSIAIGLERSEQRFLWVVRCQLPPGHNGEFVGSLEPNLNSLLPDGFVERTIGRGLVVKSFTPQYAVLKHAAVGGFVTHCGWNSVLESIMAGVAMVAWPRFADQRLNKRLLVEDVGLAVEMRGHKDELVCAEEVEEKVRWLIKSDGVKEVRASLAVMRKNARDALREGGSSHQAIEKLVLSLKIP